MDSTLNFGMNMMEIPFMVHVHMTRSMDQVISKNEEWLQVKEYSSKQTIIHGIQNGFFVDDYEFVGDGDLDEYNGRFCVTPDYPNGVYAYFCTISDNIESTGPFNNYRLPQFPYVIGDKYRSLPVDFNFKAQLLIKPITISPKIIGLETPDSILQMVVIMDTTISLILI